MNYVYFIWAAGTTRVKVGKSGNPAGRIKDLQVGSPFRLKLLFSIPAGSQNRAGKMERWFHRKFHLFRLHGEWFAFSPFTAIANLFRRKQ